MVRVLFALCCTVYEIFAVEMCMILTLTLKRGQGKTKYVNRKAMQDFLFDGNSNVCHIYYRL